VCSTYRSINNTKWLHKKPDGSTDVLISNIPIQNQISLSAEWACDEPVNPKLIDDPLIKKTDPVKKKKSTSSILISDKASTTTATSKTERFFKKLLKSQADKSDISS
jgi:hypothetical protein